MKFKKSHLILSLLAILHITPSIASVSMSKNDLPDIGTAAISTLSIAKEIDMGDYYIRQLRARAPISNDPLLNRYINSLGQRLVSVADNLQIPFHFYIVYNNEINAFAFFGGNVVINSGLIKETDNESQLASVLAHEISHVTQRHLAQAMEQRNKNSPYTWAAALGSILLGLANPELGIAAISSTLATTQQSIISFTQTNEQEADRIGIKILTKAKFDPQGMPEFMQKLADQTRFSSKPPEILLTHPLPNTRITDSRNRANLLPKVTDNSSLDYYLAKIRSQSFYSKKDPLFVQINAYKKGNNYAKIAAQYGEVLNESNNQNYQQAAKLIDVLLAKYPNNEWFLDIATDIDIERGQAKTAITRLTKLTNLKNSDILQINLANAYIRNGGYQEAMNLLHRYTHKNPDDLNGWELLAETYSSLHRNSDELAARAEISALRGNLSQAITLLTNASNSASIDRTSRARYDSRIDQLRKLQRNFKEYTR